MPYLELGPAPAEEWPQQVGTASYDGIKARRECQAYKGMLERLFPDYEKNGCRFAVKTFHSTDPYSEVVVNFDDNRPESIEFAFNVEANTPENWDEQAKLQLDREWRIGISDF